MDKHKPVLQWEKNSGEHLFFYSDDHHAKHAVFYPSLMSIFLRLEEARSWGVGISIWEIGQGLDYFFDLLWRLHLLFWVMYYNSVYSFLALLSCSTVLTCSFLGCAAVASRQGPFHKKLKIKKLKKNLLKTFIFGLKNLFIYFLKFLLYKYILD